MLPLSPLVEVALSWGVLLLMAAIGSCAAIGAWFASGRFPVSLAAVPAVLALASGFHAVDIGSADVTRWAPITVTSVLGVPVAVSRDRRFADQDVVVSWPTRQGLGLSFVLGGAFLLAMRRVGRPVPPIRTDAAGLTWWPVRRHGPRLALTLAAVILLGAWLASRTDAWVSDPAFRPAVSVAPFDAALIVGLLLMAVLACSTAGPAIRRLRLTSDAVILERPDGSMVEVPLLDLTYASSDVPGIYQHRSLLLHVGHTSVRRTHVIPADGNTDDEVEWIRAAITDVKIKASTYPVEVPEPPAELAALRQSPAARSRAASER